VSQWAIVIPVAIVLLVCGVVGAVASKDDEKPAAEAAAVGALAAPTESAAPSASPTPSASPADGVAGYLTALKAINARLVSDEERAVTRGQNTCLDITQGKPRSTVVNNARQRFSGAISVDQNMAARIVDAANAHLCPTAVIVTDPPTRQPTTREPTAPGTGDGGGNDGGGNVYYPNCAAVRAAGKAPLHRGDPGYRSGLDRDGDGVACEN
jgi:hypothetical protein